MKNKRGIAIYVANILNSLCKDNLIEFNEGIMINITRNKNDLILYSANKNTN